MDDAPTVADVLAGDADYDDLDPDGQAQVRAAWRERIGEALHQVDVAGEQAGQGKPVAVADDDGRVVVVSSSAHRRGRGE